eukprot:COSAG01_NODE_27936_length_673_cov_1.080139_1_plen_123_part_10
MTGIRLHFRSVGVVAVVSDLGGLLGRCWQSLSSIWMGNKCTVKVDEKVAIVYEQFLRMLIHCGLDANLVDLVSAPFPFLLALAPDAKTAPGTLHPPITHACSDAVLVLACDRGGGVFCVGVSH